MALCVGLSSWACGQPSPRPSSRSDKQPSKPQSVT